MTNADKAFEIAEERVDIASLVGLTHLSLSPAYTAKWDGEPALRYLATIPPSISKLTKIKELDISNTQIADTNNLSELIGLQRLSIQGTPISDITPLRWMVEIKTLFLHDTQVADITSLTRMTQMQKLTLGRTKVKNITPLAGMIGLRELWLNGTQADLSALVAPNAAWELEDRVLRKLEFTEVPVADEALAKIRWRSNKHTVGAEALARLRELRDMAAAEEPDESPAPDSSFTFLSYSRRDSNRALELKSALKAEGLAIWWDQMIDSGADWDAELRRRLKASHSVLVLWSDASAASDHVRDEAQRARRANTLASVKISDLPDDDLPLAFGMRHAPDLSLWDGSREDEAFRRLVTFLKQRQAGADSPLTVEADDDGALRLRERPVGAAPEREDDVTRDRLIAAQVKLAERTADQAKRAANAPPDLPDRLDEYAEELKAEGDKFWEVIDDAFAPAAGLLKPEEMTDDGLADAARRLLSRHRELRAYIQPMQPPDKPPRKDEVEPEVAEALIPELRATRELASHPDLPKIGPAIPRVLETAADHIEEEVQSFPMNDVEAEQRRTRVGRALQNAKGVAAGLATADPAP